MVLLQLKLLFYLPQSASCASTVTDCPYGSTTTDTIAVSTTVCLVTETPASLVTETPASLVTETPTSLVTETPVSPVTVISAAHTTSVVYTTKTYTISSCYPTVTNCPYGSTTVEVGSYITTYPITGATPAVPTIPPVVHSSSVVYTTKVYTISSCHPSVTDCPYGSKTTKSIPLSTIIFSVTPSAKFAPAVESSLTSTTTNVYTLTVALEPSTGGGIGTGIPSSSIPTTIATGDNSGTGVFPSSIPTTIATGSSSNTSVLPSSIFTTIATEHGSGTGVPLSSILTTIATGGDSSTSVPLSSIPTTIATVVSSPSDTPPVAGSGTSTSPVAPDSSSQSSAGERREVGGKGLAIAAAVGFFAVFII
ncbi:hypothetical protein B7463_g12504, partial [Scytalidium lignicola]